MSQHDTLSDRASSSLPRSRIIDVRCGSGRHTLALVARGHRLTGVDISTEAITYAQRTAADAHVDWR